MDIWITLMQEAERAEQGLYPAVRIGIVKTRLDAGDHVAFLSCEKGEIVYIAGNPVSTSMKPPPTLHGDGKVYTDEGGEDFKGMCIDFALLLHFTGVDGIQVIDGGLIFSQCVDYHAQKTNVLAWKPTLSMIFGSKFAKYMQDSSSSKSGGRTLEIC